MDDARAPADDPHTDPEARARRAGLRYVAPDELPLTRRRRGRGFQYLNGGGAPLRDAAVRRRLAALVVPPAWTEVRLARDPLAHIQAVGRDAEGRRQYRYHDLWTRSGDAVKAARLLTLGSGLGELRAWTEAQMRRRTPDSDFALACAVALLDRAGLRVGYAEYGRADGGRGAMTLQNRHVRIEGATVTLSFPGKSGKRIRRELEDGLLAGALGRLKAAGGPDLFDCAGVALGAEDVNAHLRDALGGESSARDFRTFRASAIVAGAMAPGNGGVDNAAGEAGLRAATRAAADFLCNTLAVCRSSYVHPLVQTAFMDEALDRKSLFAGPPRKGLDKAETVLMRIVERAA